MEYQCSQALGGLKIPKHVFDALMSIAYDYMQEKDFNKLMDTDWNSPVEAESAWSEVKSCLQQIAKSTFPGPKETLDDLQEVLKSYHLTFDGAIIKQMSILKLQKVDG